MHSDFLFKTVMINALLTMNLQQQLRQSLFSINSCSNNTSSKTITKFSKSVLEIKTRPVVTVDLGTKWMPNSDSASDFMPAYKCLGHQGLPNSFHGHLKSQDFSRIIRTFHMKTNLEKTFFSQVYFYLEKPNKNLRKQ